MLAFFTVQFAHAESLSEMIDDWADSGREYFDGIIQNSDYSGNPLNTSNDEISHVNEKAFESLKVGKDLTFTLHGLLEAIIIALEPVGIDATILFLIAGGATIVVLFIILKKNWEHIEMIGVITAIVVGVIMFFGANPKFS